VLTLSWAGLAYCLSSSMPAYYTALALLGIVLGGGVTWLLGRSRRADGALV